MTWQTELATIMGGVDFVQAELDIDDGTPSATDGDRQYVVRARQMGRRYGSALSPPTLFLQVLLYMTSDLPVDLTRDIERECPENWLLTGTEDGTQLSEITEAEDEIEGWHVYSCVLERLGDA